MDWTQTITLGATLITYITAMCVFFYYLNEKSIDKLEKNIEKLDQRIDKNEAHWREMFMYMNNRIDTSKGDEKKIN